MNTKHQDQHPTKPEPDAPQPRGKGGKPRSVGSAAALPSATPLPREKQTRNREPTGDYTPERIALTIKEAAIAMGCTEYFLRGQVAAGNIRVSQLSKYIVRILPEELREWAQRMRIDLGSSRELTPEPPLPEEGEGLEEPEITP